MFALLGIAPNAHPEESKYMDLVRTALDTLISEGRDRYGDEKSPMFAANLNIETMQCMQEPPESQIVHVRCRRDRRRSPGGANQYFDQATFRAMDVMWRVTDAPKYRDEILKALKFNLNRAVDSHGLPALGGHTFWNFYTDALDSNGKRVHEFWNWSMAWDLWWRADPQGARRYADLIWEWHVVDKETGETNRHSDQQKGWPFPFMSGNFIESWAKAYERTGDEKYRRYCQKLSDYYWSVRNQKTDLITAGGVDPSQGTRADTKNFAMGGAPMLAYYLIKSGKMIDNDDLVKRGRAYLDAYAKYGYDSEKELFFASLTLDGKRVKPDAERRLVNGQACTPPGYCATWQPYVGWYELPLPVAQVYAWAAETVDRNAYLETALRWGSVISKSWKRRYGGFSSGAEYREALSEDRELARKYKTIDYPYTAPYGLFADHFGRTIQFALTLHRLTNDEKWRDFAKEVADSACDELWKDRIFVGHPEKPDLYENCDNVGILLYSLLQLHESLHPSGADIPVAL
jgi:hypothetical protein